VAQTADEAFGDQLQEHIAVLVTQGVVDLLELVKVHDEQRE
jgi:hypothetical protein